MQRNQTISSRFNAMNGKDKESAIYGFSVIALFFISIVWYFWPAEEKEAIIYENSAAVYWLREYFEKFPIGGTWEISGVFSDDDNKNIDIYLYLPRDTASKVIKKDIREQLIIASVGCPGTLEPVWTMIKPAQTIYVHLSSPQYDDFAWHNCRNL